MNKCDSCSTTDCLGRNLDSNLPPSLKALLDGVFGKDGVEVHSVELNNAAAMERLADLFKGYKTPVKDDPRLNPMDVADGMTKQLGRRLEMADNMIKQLGRQVEHLGNDNDAAHIENERLENQLKMAKIILVSHGVNLDEIESLDDLLAEVAG